MLFIGTLWFVKDHRTLARYGYTMGFAGLILIMLPGILPSSISEVNGAKIWLRLSIFSIQPGEFAKVLLMIFFSALLIAKRDLFTTAGRRILGMEFPRARDLAPLLVAWGVSVGVLTLENDLGTSLLYFGVMLVLLYTATERVSWLIIGLVFFLAGAVAGTDLAGSAGGLQPRRLPAQPGAVRAGHRRGRRDRAGRRPAGAGAVRLERLHHRLHR
jgi:cell division protein FtsW (lipid II flippase)